MTAIALEPLTHGVAVCPACAAELQIVCPNGHDPFPIATAPTRDAELERLRQSNARYARDNEKLITRNLELSNALEFHQRRERNRQAAIDRAGESPVGKRINYDPKVCSCGTTFIPTGPRAKFCATCREQRA